MRVLLAITDQDFYPDQPPKPLSGFRIRNTARAIVMNDQGQVALLHSTVHNTHKLPGGGIEEGEDIAMALQRELVEEMGSIAMVTAEVGIVNEYRGRTKLHQLSRCFLARQSGPFTAPSLTGEEETLGMEIVWADSLDAALELVKADTPPDYPGHFIRRRELAFLEAAKSMLAH